MSKKTEVHSQNHPGFKDSSRPQYGTLLPITLTNRQKYPGTKATGNTRALLINWS